MRGTDEAPNDLFEDADGGIDEVGQPLSPLGSRVGQQRRGRLRAPSGSVLCRCGYRSPITVLYTCPSSSLTPIVNCLFASPFAVPQL
jgi:hypothetical protein